MKLVFKNQLFVLLLFTCLTLKSLTLFSQKSEFLTFYEKSGKTQTANYEEAIKFSMELAKYSKRISYFELGKSSSNFTIPFLIADKDGLKSPEKIRKKGRLILLVMANIHPGEPDGLDAGFILFRDIAVGKSSALDLLENVSIVFLPVINPDGLNRFGKYNRINQNGPLEVGWRTNSQNLNLNRDFIKAQSPEMKQFHMLASRWKPDFYIDCHTTNGADYQYVVTYSIETGLATDSNISDWNKNVYLPQILNKMENDGFPMFEYVSFKTWHDHTQALVTYSSSPILSNGYFAALNRPGLLLETHMLKPYNQRVDGTLLVIKHTLKLMNLHQNSLKTAISKADEFTVSSEFRKRSFPIQFKLSDRLDTIDFLGYEFDIQTSELTGSRIFNYNQNKPTTHQLQIHSEHLIANSISLPYAYIVPFEYRNIIQILKYQGVKFFRLSEDIQIDAEQIRFSDVSFSSLPQESCQRANYNVERFSSKVVLPKNSFVVPINQTQARIIIHTLEPESSASLASWGFFNAVFERKEYAEIYIMEKIAKKMIDENPSLLTEFNEAKNQNPEYLSIPYNAVNWFYQKSPWYDTKHNLYPIKMIHSEKDFEKLKTLKL